EDHRINSSHQREKCVIASAATAQSSTAKSRSATASSEFSAIAPNPSSRAVNSRSIGKVVPAGVDLRASGKSRPGEGAGAERQHIDTAPAIQQTRTVAMQHLEPREHVV